MIHYTFTDSGLYFSIQSDATNLFLVGSFTHWKIDKSFKMDRKGNIHSLLISNEKTLTIANSGYPEYYFWNSDTEQPLPFDDSYPDGYFFNNQFNQSFNYLIHHDDIGPKHMEKISTDNHLSFQIKSSISDFKTEADLANFRNLDGGKLSKQKVYRSYHPQIPSRSHDPRLCDIEIERQKAVRTLIQKKRINTIINLSDNHEKLVTKTANMAPSIYTKMMQRNQIRYIPISYETAYFLSGSNQAFKDGELGFEDGIRQLINVIVEASPPYLVHCRLGSDRTGIVSAFIQMLMGASKEQIVENYSLTNQLGIGEYRSSNLVIQSLTNALGTRCFDDTEQATTEYLIKLGIDENLIKRAKQNLA